MGLRVQQRPVSKTTRVQGTTDWMAKPHGSMVYAFDICKAWIRVKGLGFSLVT